MWKLVALVPCVLPALALASEIDGFAAAADGHSSQGGGRHQGESEASVVCQAGSMSYNDCEFDQGIPPNNQKLCFAGINTGQNAQQGGSCEIPSPSNKCMLTFNGNLVWVWRSAIWGVSCCNCFQKKNWSPTPTCPEHCRLPQCESGNPMVSGSKELVNGKCRYRCSVEHKVGGKDVRYCGSGGEYDGAGSVDCSMCRQSSGFLQAPISRHAEDDDATAMLQVSSIIEEGRREDVEEADTALEANPEL